MPVSLCAVGPVNCVTTGAVKGETLLRGNLDFRKNFLKLKAQHCMVIVCVYYYNLLDVYYVFMNWSENDICLWVYKCGKWERTCRLSSFCVRCRHDLPFPWISLNCALTPGGNINRTGFIPEQNRAFSELQVICRQSNQINQTNILLCHWVQLCLLSVKALDG